MTKEIENIIRKNKSFFDSEEPSLDHFKKFKIKISSYKFKNKNKSIKIFRYAAAATVLLLISFSIYYFQIEEPNTTKLSDISQKYYEVENYYLEQLEIKLKELNNKSPDTYKAFVKDMKVIDDAYISLQKELYLNPDNEFIIELMMVNYKTRIEIIERINNRLDNFKYALNEY